MPALPVTGATKREIGKSTGETPPPQRTKSESAMRKPVETPPWPTSGAAGSGAGTDGQPTTADIMAAMAEMQNAMVGMETRITQVVKGEVTKQVGIVAKDVTKIKTTVDTLVNDMSSMKKRIHDLESGNSGGGTTNSGPRKDEIMEVVVKGFKDKKPQAELMAEIESMLKTILGEVHGVKIDVPGDPCNHGVLTFDNNTNKLEFYKKVEEKHEDLDENISFTNKISWRDRVVEKKK